MSLITTWIEGAGPETGAGAGGGGVPRWEQAVSTTREPGASSGRGNSVRELVTHRDSWTVSRVLEESRSSGVRAATVGLRKTRFRCGQVGLRVKLGHPAVNGPERPRGAEHIRPVPFHLPFFTGENFVHGCTIFHFSRSRFCCISMFLKSILLFTPSL